MEFVHHQPHGAVEHRHCPNAALRAPKRARRQRTSTAPQRKRDRPRSHFRLLVRSSRPTATRARRRLTTLRERPCSRGEFGRGFRAMWDFDIGRTLGIMSRTWPFIALRLVVYFGITVAYVLATGTGAGVGYGVGNIFADGRPGQAWLSGAASSVSGSCRWRSTGCANTSSTSSRPAISPSWCT